MNPLILQLRRFTPVLLCLAVAFIPSPAIAQVQEFHMVGSGTGETNCIETLYPGCTTWAWGQATGTPIVDGSFIARFDLGSPASSNGFPHPTQGLCLPTTFGGNVTTANGETVNFNHVGVMCEETTPGSPYHFNGTYHVTGGTGQFADAAGGGNLAVVWTRVAVDQPVVVFFTLDGVIQ